MGTETLGNIVKTLLSDLDYDEVSNISENTESLQVARIVISTYKSMVLRLQLPVEKRLFQLDATNTSTPTFMRIPSEISKVETIYYDTRADYNDPIKLTKIPHVSPEVFLRTSNGLNTSDPAVTTVLINSDTPLLIRNDRQPSCWTSFNNVDIVFDAYDSDVEANLQNSKTQCFGVLTSDIPLVDSSPIPLDDHLIPLLLAEARVRCFIRLKQSRDPSSEDEARRLLTATLRERYRQDGEWCYPGYGRPR